MVASIQIISIVITVGTAIIFSGLFSSELFTWYNVIILDSDNSTIVRVENIGILQAKNPTLFILTSDDVEKVTLDCLEGKFIPEENQKIVKIKFERLSSGIKCNVLLDNIEKKNVTDVVITSDNKSTYTYNSNNIWLLFSIIIAGILISEIIGTILAFTFVIDDFYIMFFHFFNKKSNNIDIVRMKIKSEFGIKLSDLSIEMLNLLHHEKKTLLQISVQLGTPKFITKRRLPLFLFKIPVFIIKHRLKKLEKLELITSDRKIHPKIKEIIDLT